MGHANVEVLRPHQELQGKKEEAGEMQGDKGDGHVYENGYEERGGEGWSKDREEEPTVVYRMEARRRGRRGRHNRSQIDLAKERRAREGRR